MSNTGASLGDFVPMADPLKWLRYRRAINYLQLPPCPQSNLCNGIMSVGERLLFVLPGTSANVLQTCALKGFSSEVIKSPLTQSQGLMLQYWNPCGERAHSAPYRGEKVINLSRLTLMAVSHSLIAELLYGLCTM